MQTYGEPFFQRVSPRTRDSPMLSVKKLDTRPVPNRGVLAVLSHVFRVLEAEERIDLAR